MRVETGLTILRNADVYAPEPLGRRDLAVAAGRIVAMEPRLDPLPSSWGAIEIELEGKRLTPGLIDAHVHITGGGGESGPESRIAPLAVESVTRGGTTTVVGLLGADDETRSVADLLARTRAFAASGPGAWCLSGGYRVPPMTLTGSVRSDVVHIAEILGVGEIAISDHRSSQPTAAELARVAADAYMGGLLSGKAGLVHIHVGDGERGLELVRQVLESTEIPPRVFHPTHVNRKRALFDEAMEVARSGCTIDVSAFPAGPGDDGGVGAADAVMAYLDSDLPEERVTVSSDAGGSLPEFDDAGRVVRMGVGRPDALSGTLTELLRRGLPADRALAPFTANVARVLCLNDAGRISPGCRADLIVLDEAHGIESVMVAGRWHLQEGKAVPFESPGPPRSPRTLEEAETP